MLHYRERLSISFQLFRIKFNPVLKNTAQEWVWGDRSSLLHVGEEVFSILSLLEASHLERRGLPSTEGKIGVPALLWHPTKSEGLSLGVQLSRMRGPTEVLLTVWRRLPNMKSG
jgi:hypothetical protein